MSEEVSPARVMRTLGLIFAVQLLGFVTLIIGVVLLMLTFAHNSSLDCSTVSFGGGGCSRHSYAAAIAVLVTGGVLFVVTMVVSAQYALRHVGTPALGALLARRRYARRSDDS